MSKLNYQEKIPNNVNLSEDLSIINTNTRNERIKNFKIGGKKWDQMAFKTQKYISGLLLR